MNDETELAQALKVMLPYVMEFGSMFGMDIGSGESQPVVRKHPVGPTLRVIEGGKS